MGRFWYLDDDTENPQLDHHRVSPEYLTAEELFKKTGVEYFKSRHARVWITGEAHKNNKILEELSLPFKDLISSTQQLACLGVAFSLSLLNIATYKTDGILDKIKSDRGYTYEDELVCSPEFIEKFYIEHLHADEEIRLVTGGSGYFEVRDVDDRWVRLALEVGDMIIIPSGLYHRFTYDTKNYIAARRFFVSEPVWCAHNRPADDMDCRKEYVEKLRKGFAAV